MKITITRSFKNAAKKLHKNQKNLVEDAIEAIVKDPLAGEMKIGDLAGVRVYKFHINDKLMLIAYNHVELNELDTKNKNELLSLSGHKNFYRDLKRNK